MFHPPSPTEQCWKKARTFTVYSPSPKSTLSWGKGGSEINWLKMFPKIAKCPNNFGQDCSFGYIGLYKLKQPGSPGTSGNSTCKFLYYCNTLSFLSLQIQLPHARCLSESPERSVCHSSQNIPYWWCRSAQNSGITSKWFSTWDTVTSQLMLSAILTQPKSIMLIRQEVE